MVRDGAVKTSDSWSLLVAELAALLERGFQLSAQGSQEIIRALAAANTLGPPAAREALESCRPAAFSLTVHCQAPMWRLGDGQALTCELKVHLPLDYPVVFSPALGGHIAISSSGNLGREAAKIVSTLAHVTVAQLRSDGAFSSSDSEAPRYLLYLAEWLESIELHELAAAQIQPSPSESCDALSRAFVRFHHVASPMKRSYMRMWADDLGVSALLAAGQPAMLLAEGPFAHVKAYIERATKVCHWGPTPAKLVAATSLDPQTQRRERPLPKGLVEVVERFPQCVVVSGTYNERDCVNYSTLADELRLLGHEGAAAELKGLLSCAFAHRDGRVEESLDGSGWVGYRQPDAHLTPPTTSVRPVADKAEKKAPRWRKGTTSKPGTATSGENVTTDVAATAVTDGSTELVDAIDCTAVQTAMPTSTRASALPRRRWG